MTSVGDVLRQMIENAMYSANITSANPLHVNHVESIDINPLEFETILEEAIKEIVDTELSTRQTETLGSELSIPSNEGGGIKEGQALGLARKGLSTAQNPTSIVQQGLSFLPHAALVAFVISMMPIIFRELTKPGGPFDLRWKRIMQDEFNAFLDRQTQHNTKIGTRQVIIQSRAGFINMNGADSNSNNLRLIRKGWTGREDISELDYTDHSKGLF